MRKERWKRLTTGQIRPEGWLKRQLEIQARGLSGHLDLVAGYPGEQMDWGRQGRLGESALLRLRDGMKILEVGCAGGLLCHRLKERLSKAEITGLDLDTGHIAYAKKKTRELELQCDFVAGDAVNLPFGDDTFDTCYSHTVMNFCDPEKFVGEQYRVLKPGG